MKGIVSLSTSVLCSPEKIQKYLSLKSSFYLTQHHGDVIPHEVNFAPIRKLPKTVASSEDVSVGDESSTTSGGLVGLGGSQEQQSSPRELIDLRLLPANRGQLMINISFSSRLIEILPEQNSSFDHRNISRSRPWP